MTGAPLHRFTLAEVLCAAEAGALRGPFELLDGQLLSIPISGWQAETAARITAALPDPGVTKQAGPLLAGTGALLQPDVWITDHDAAPVGRLRAEVGDWSPVDVLLVVEVSDVTVELDLSTKARLYGAAGFAHYWVVIEDGIFVHSDPVPAGYRLRQLRGRTDSVDVPYAGGLTLCVDDVVALPPEG